MKRVSRVAAWLILFMVICSTFSSSFAAVENEGIMTEVDMEEELNKQLEELFNEVSEKADEIAAELNLIEDIINPDIYNLDEEEYKQWKMSFKRNIQSNEGFFPFTVDNNIMSNDYIGIMVHRNGMFNMGTTGGNPNVSTDNDKDLLYHYPNGETSYTTIRIDGVDHTFMADGPPTFNENGTQVTSVMTMGDLIIKQIISLMLNPNTGREDTAEIRYEVINISDTSHQVGIRIMLDTMLGDNDGAPFKVPGIGDVTKEVEIVGNRIPQYWQAFDNLDSPSIVASGSFYKVFSERPDKVQFAAWPGIVNIPWDYVVNPNTSVTRDSAVGIYFNPKEIRPAEAMNVATYYGIGDFSTSDEDDEISLRATAPQELQLNPQTGNYYSNPFTITGYIKNNSDEIAKNVKINLSLPQGGELVLTHPNQNTINIGDLGIGEERTISYTVLAKTQTIDKVLNYSISLESENIEGKVLNLIIKLPKATISQGGTIVLDKTSLSLNIGETYRLRATLNNINGNITWLSDNPTVATVSSSGVVTARSPGIVSIKASVGGKVAKCTVTVVGSTSGITDVEFLHSTINLGINENRYLNLTFTPFNTPNKRIKSFTSSDPSVASVTPSGSVKGLKPGTATITAVTEAGNMTAKCTINVIEREPVLEMGEGIGFTSDGVGPEINFAGKKFSLFKIKVGTEVKLGKVAKLVYNAADDKYVAYIGDLADAPGTNDTKPDGTLTESAKRLRIDTYQKIKRMMNMVGKQTNREFYNSYRSLVKKSSPFSINGDKTIFGYVEFVKTNSGYRLASGDVCVLFDGSVNATYNFPPAPVVYIKFTLGGSIQTGLQLKLKEAGNLSKGINVAGKVEGKFKPKIGVGGDLVVAKVEAGIEGEVKSTILLQPHLNPVFSPERDFSMSMGSKLYLKYKAFVFINNKHWIDLPNWKIYPRSTGRMADLSAIEISYDDLVLMPRDYIIRPSEFMGNSPRISTFAMNTSNIENKTFKTNIYPNSELQLALLPDGKMFLVWIEDDLERIGEANYTALYYSVFDGINWSEPKQINNDGTADFSPSIVSVGEDVYITWQNAEVLFDNNVTPEDMAKNMGIRSAKWSNDELSVFTVNEPDDTLDNQPIIISDGTDIAIVWTANTANDIFGFEGETIILQSQLAEGSFTEPKEVYRTNGMISGLTAAYHEGESIIVYSKDMDGEVETFEDRELMMIIENGEPVNITNTQDIADINPKFVMVDGKAELYWYSESGICYMPDIQTREIYVIEEGNLVGANFHVLVNGHNKIIVWEEATGLKSDLFGMFYDNEKGQWGNAIQLTDLDTRIRNTSSILTEEGFLYTSYISAPVLENVADEESPFGDANLMITRLEPGYNLMVDGGVVYDWRLVYGGSELSLGLYVENQGQITMDGLVGEIYKGNELISKQDIDINLISGKGEFIDIHYMLPENLVAHEIRVVVLPKQGSDYDISNNIADVNIGNAQIELEKPVVAGMGSSRTITAEIKNLGYADSEEIIVHMTIDGRESIVDTIRISSIPSQGNRIVQFDIPITRDTFTSIDQEGILVYINVKNMNDGLLATNFVEIKNVYEEDSITLSSVAMAGNTIILNIDNNLPEDVKGLLCVDSIGEDGNKIIYGQEVEMESLYGSSMELDLTGIQMDYESLNVYVLDLEDKVISNVVDINEPNILKVKKPSAIPVPGAYNKEQKVTITTDTEGATIYYTIDESEPTEDSILYNQPINVDKTMTIKVKAIKEGMLDSEVQILHYIIQKESPTNPPAPSPQPSGSYIGGTIVKEKSFLEQFKDLSAEKKSKIMENIPYTVKTTGFSIEQLKKITQGNFTDKQLQEIVNKPEIFIKLIKENNIHYKEVSLVRDRKLIFKDMTDNHWANPFISKALKLGYVDGFEDHTFRPNNLLTVYDTFAFLDRVLVDNDIIGNKLPRTIVEKYINLNKDHWSYYSTASISSRLSEATLKRIHDLKGGEISRELVAQVIYEATEGKLPQVKEPKSFNDINKTEYKEALDYCIRAGLLNGTSNTTMEPKRTVTRAEMMVIISKLSDLL